MCKNQILQISFIILSVFFILSGTAYGQETKACPNFTDVDNFLLNNRQSTVYLFNIESNSDGVPGNFFTSYEFIKLINIENAGNIFLDEGFFPVKFPSDITIKEIKLTDSTGLEYEIINRDDGFINPTIDIDDDYSDSIYCIKYKTDNIKNAGFTMHGSSIYYSSEITPSDTGFVIMQFPQEYTIFYNPEKDGGKYDNATKSITWEVEKDKEVKVGTYVFPSPTEKSLEFFQSISPILRTLDIAVTKHEISTDVYSITNKKTYDMPKSIDGFDLFEIQRIIIPIDIEVNVSNLKIYDKRGEIKSLNNKPEEITEGLANTYFHNKITEELEIYSRPYEVNDLLEYEIELQFDVNDENISKKIRADTGVYEMVVGIDKEIFHTEKNFTYDMKVKMNLPEDVDILNYTKEHNPQLIKNSILWKDNEMKNSDILFKINYSYKPIEDLMIIATSILIIGCVIIFVPLIFKKNSLVTTIATIIGMSIVYLIFVISTGDLDLLKEYFVFIMFLVLIFTPAALQWIINKYLIIRLDPVQLDLEPIDKEKISKGFPN